MTLVAALVVFVVGYVSGIVTRIFASLAAVAALVLAVLGLAAPESVFALIDPVLSFYEGNELLFLSGFLFGIAHRSRSVSED
ncbi:hypothetical protein ACKVMT_01460 [Halobacteriales archaeon Cl-PHB]